MLDAEERKEWLPAVTGNVSQAQAINVMDKFIAKRRAEAAAELKVKTGQSGFKEFQKFKYFNDDYQQQSKPVRKTLDTVAQLENLLAQEQNGVVDKAVTSQLTSVFANNVRAMAELQQWKNLGDIGERITGSINRFFAGDRTEAQRADINNMISEYKKELTRNNDELKANTYDQAIQFDLDPQKLFEDAGKRFVFKADKHGRKTKIDMWRRTTELVE